MWLRAVSHQARIPTPPAEADRPTLEVGRQQPQKVYRRMNADKHEFLAALAEGLPAQERLITCGFAGDPNTAPPNAWRPRPWFPGRELDLGSNWNAYVTVSSFGRAPDGSFRRRSEAFAAGRALMVDDVGTKVDPKIVAHMQPSAVVETSPGNFQWWYFLARPERDRERFDGVIRAFIYGNLLGSDPGMNGVNRVGRIPGFVNGKPQHGGWRCPVREMSGRRWQMSELIEGFRLKLEGRRYAAPTMRTETALERAALWSATHKLLDQIGMMKKREPDPSGWIEMHCPWVEGHTDRADTGAALRRPHADNGWFGGFRCHHGHCAGKAWQQLTEWTAEAGAEIMSGVNSSNAVELFERRLANLAARLAA